MDHRRLPSVDALASELTRSGLPRSLCVEIARASVDHARRDGGDPVAAARAAARSLEAARPRRVVNGTGVLLHTNLGRAPLHPEAAAAADRVARGYANVELSLLTGERGSRGAYPRELLTALTGAEDAAVVNNNAGALLLALMSLAAGRAVPVSRGELIEIGGSYRLPEIMAASGARLIEVGTTNRTRPDDYRRAVLENDPALLLKVHPSNYRMDGFVEEAGLGDLAQLARETGIPLVHDAGSGLLDERVPWLPGPPPAWLRGEPGLRQSLETGSDLVLASGDKLLGGPQAGIVAGAGDLVERLRKHPAARALRVDGPTVAALTVTLELYASGRGSEIPLWAMASLPPATLEERARAVLAASGVAGEIREGASTPGAGSVPTTRIPTPILAVEAPGDAAYLALLAADPPVVGRREAGALILDLRTVEPEWDEHVARALAQACRS